MYVSNTYANLDLRRAEILRAVMGTESIRVLEQRYDNGRVGRITDWFNKQCGISPSVFRRKYAGGATAIVFGEFYFLDAQRILRMAIANWLETKFSNSNLHTSLPDGDYQIWLVDDYTCVMCADDYRKTKSVYRKVYKYKLDLDHPLLKGTMSCIHTTDTRGVPLPDSTIAYMLNLVWVPQSV